MRQTLIYILLVLIVCIGYLSIAQTGWPALQQNQAPHNHLDGVKHFLAASGLAGLLVTAQFFALGWLLYSVYHHQKMKSVDDAYSIRRWPVVLVGLGLTVVLRGMRAGQLPGAIDLVLPCFGCLLGIWIASACWRGLRATFWLVPQLAALVLVLFAMGGTVCYLGTSAEPFEFESPSVSAEEKSRLAKLIEGRENLGNGQERMQLSERDVNLIMAAACTHLSMDAKAKTRFRSGVVGLDLSLGLPLGHYLNIQGDYQFEIHDGEVKFRADRLSVGRLVVPAMILHSLSNSALAMAKADKQLQDATSSIHRLQFTDQQLDAEYQPKSLIQDLKLALHRYLGADQVIVTATSVHARHLLDAAAELPGGDEQFSTFLQTAFKLAKKRSLQGRDPIVENRSAILALAIVLGHPRVETFVGMVTDKPMQVQAQQYRGQVALRRRFDWTQHFFVSAGLALTFNTDVSDGVGLFKEEADSAKGGSGFSFADLLADRAGVRFAGAATRDRAAATRMQELLSQPFSIDDVFPQAGDLPEGLPDDEFQQAFGGVDGKEYKKVLAEIERRLDTCIALTI